MDEDLSNGTYNIWATNSNGTGVANGFNISRPQWISVDSVAPGMTFKVLGKNMSSAAYGSGNKAFAAFVGENGVYDVTPISVNEFSVELECPEIPAGEYDIYISNDAKTWNKPEDGLKLTVTEEVNDPYNVNAAWVDEINFNKVVYADNYGAKPNDSYDDSKAINNAISTLKSRYGSGVVVLSEGTYNISQEKIDVKSNIVLAGAGKDKTTLNYTGFINTTWGNSVLYLNAYTGAYGFEIKQDNVNTISAPDEYIIMLNHTFLENVRIDVPMEPDMVQFTEVKNRGFGVLVGEGYNVIDNCEFKGYNALPTNSEIDKYAYMGNCDIDTTVGVVGIVGSYVVFENNDIEHHMEYSPENAPDLFAQGIFTRGPSYIYNNSIKNVGHGEGNDGELIAAESYKGSIKLAGTITNASEDTVTVSTYTDIAAYNNGTLSWNWNLDEAGYNENYLIITRGRGMGQYRKIKSFDENTKTIVLEDAFDVLPNKDSHFTVQELSENVTMYKNYGENAKKGFWLFQDCVDGVISQNTGINTQGAFVRSVYAETNDKYNNDVTYFNRIDKNYFKGQSVGNIYTNVAACVHVSVEGPNPDIVNNYGTEITDNTIIGDGKDYTEGTGPQCWVEAPPYNGISIVCTPNEPANAYNVIRGVIINNNNLSNVTDGIVVKSYVKSNNADYDGIRGVTQRNNTVK